ncbi:MAG TPA: AbrB/MazE/SpoVT family DNA-binding domain-containing protein [Candidatus Sulfotelmatobacter sp.]
MRKEARITSKGQITVPLEVRKILGVTTGDKLLFEGDGKGIIVRPVRNYSTFSKYRAIGNPGIDSGKKGVNRWLRALRGQ